jgi:hypothetical protein
VPFITFTQMQMECAEGSLALYSDAFSSVPGIGYQMSRASAKAEGSAGVI